MEILIHPHPILKQVAEPIDFEKTTPQEIVDIIEKMAETLSNQKYGQKLGLAAPQIGISKRIIIVGTLVMINPSFVPSFQTIQMLESCYSVPEKIFKVTRYKYGWVHYQDRGGIHHSFKIAGTEARVFLHELSHLDGFCCNELGDEIK